MKQAILYSNHEEIGKIDMDKILHIYSWLPRQIEEDLIKIVTKDGIEYFCDEIEVATFNGENLFTVEDIKEFQS
jgi:hypothetical protein